jgi:hypothetical protein
MSKIKDALWHDYKNASDRIESLSIEEKGYQAAVEERDKIRNEIIKVEQLEQDELMNLSKIEAENKRDKIRNIISVSTFAVSTGVSVFAIVKTFKFDQNSTVTSTLGRNILSGVVPKMFRK